MTPAEIIAAAREAGFDIDAFGVSAKAQKLQRFAAIIAAKQREKDLAGIKDTVTFWKKNRLLGISASMASSGYENIDILRAFDEIAAAIMGQE